MNQHYLISNNCTGCKKRIKPGLQRALLARTRRRVMKRTVIRPEKQAPTFNTGTRLAQSLYYADEMAQRAKYWFSFRAVVCCGWQRCAGKWGSRVGRLAALRSDFSLTCGARKSIVAVVCVFLGYTLCSTLSH